jgi:hypothetical protein
VIKVPKREASSIFGEREDGDNLDFMDIMRNLLQRRVEVEPGDNRSDRVGALA